MKTVESVLTVFFEEPFWVGVFERTGSKYEVCKVIFGAEPKGGEIWDFLLKRGGSLAFSEGLNCEIPDTKRQNPKRMQKEAKKNRERLGVDYNMNMAVYVIPFLNYSRNEDCEKLSRRIVEVWNEKKVTSLTLSHSSYDDIAEGFRSKLCYITTAVCEHMQKEDDCYEMQVMRRFRDEYLMQTDEGRSIIKDYYEIAPGIVMILNMQKDAAAIYKQLYCKYLLPCVQLIEQGKKAQCQALYMQMVQNLKMQYI